MVKTMKKLLLALFLISTPCYATQISLPTTWATNDTVTNVKLNGDNNAIVAVVNGGLDDGNMDTTNGYHVFKLVGALPAAGTQGKVYFLSSDNTLNFDTGSAFNKAVSVNSATNGDSIYYNSGWQRLGIGSTGQAWVVSGGVPTWGYPSLGATSAGDLAYYTGTTWGRVASGATAGTILQTGNPPTWVNALGSVSDYGTSTTTSTARQATAVKLAYGQFSFGANGSQAITNLPFTSSTSYTVTVGMGYGVTTTENIRISQDSASQFTLYNDVNRAVTVYWHAIGI